MIFLVTNWDVSATPVHRLALLYNAASCYILAYLKGEYWLLPESKYVPSTETAYVIISRVLKSWLWAEVEEGASMFEVIRQQRLRVWFDWVWLAWEFSFRFQNHPPPPLATNPPGLAVRPYSSSSLCSANSFQPIQARSIVTVLLLHFICWVFVWTRSE